MAERSVELGPAAGPKKKSRLERWQELRQRGGLTPQEIEETLNASDELNALGTVEQVEDQSIAEELRSIDEETRRQIAEEASKRERTKKAWRDAANAAFLLRILAEDGYLPPDIPASELPAYLGDLADKLRRESLEEEGETK